MQIVFGILILKNEKHSLDEHIDTSFFFVGNIYIIEKRGYYSWQVYIEMILLHTILNKVSY